MAEAKLGIYQLAVAGVVPTRQAGVKLPSSPLGNTRVVTAGLSTGTRGNFFQRNNINMGSVMGFLQDAIGIAGGIGNLINSFKKGEPIRVGEKILDPEQAELVYKAALANQQAGGGQAGNEAMMRVMEQNQAMTNMFMMKMMEGKSDPPASKDNTGLYIGLGVGGLAIIVIVALLMKK